MATDRSPGRRVAVFGSSEPSESSPAYAEAREVGRLLAEAGVVVVTGGYGGVMEAASRGAVEAGGRTLGVTTAVFEARSPNPYLTERRHEADLHDRTRTLIDLADGFIILSGRAGTLAELAFLWALERAGVDRAPRVLVGALWSSLLAEMIRLDLLEPALRSSTLTAESPAAAVPLLLGALGPEEA